MIMDAIYDRAGIPAVMRYYDMIVELNGEIVPRERWHIMPSPHDHVLVYMPVHGSSGGGESKNPLRTIMSVIVAIVAIVVTIYAPYLGAWLGIPGLLAAKGGVTALGMFVGGVAGSVVGAAGGLLVNALFPITTGGLTQQNLNDSPAYSIAGSSNKMIPFGSIPVVLGVNRYYPPLGAKPYTELVGNDEYLRMVFIWGYGPLKIENIKIGETLLSAYTDYEIETREGRDTDDPLTLFPGEVHQESIGLEITHVGGMLVRTAPPNVDELSVDIGCPFGIYLVTAQGQHVYWEVEYEVAYREVGAGTWISSGYTIGDNTTSAVRQGQRWKVDRTKSYEVGITRVTDDIDPSHGSDKFYWSVLRGFVNEDPIQYPYPLARTAIRIKATSQLNGVIDELNATVSSYCETWNGSVWGGEAVSQNPAALIHHILQSNANARAQSDDQINNDNLGEFYDFCETAGYKFNMIRDFKSSVWQTIADIAFAGRGAPSVVDGKHGVIWDDPAASVVQHITPRNSWGFSSDKVLFNMPHAFRIQFVNEDNGYVTDERIVYDDGYTAGNATIFESLTFQGITDPDLVWKHGRYHIAQARLRPEMFTLFMDFEHLVCRRGSKVLVAHDVPLWGSYSGRVTAVTLNEAETHVTAVTLDETIVFGDGAYYSCRFRLADEDNSSVCYSVVHPGSGTATNTLTFSAVGGIPIAAAPSVGDLAMFGVADQETTELLVKEIERSGEFVAKLTLVDVAAGIYEADEGAIPAYAPNITNPVALEKIRPGAPSICNVESGTAALEEFNGGIRSRILVGINPPVATVRLSKYILKYKSNDGESWNYMDIPLGNLSVYITGVDDGQTYRIAVCAVSAYGIESAWSEIVTVTVVGQSEIPSDVTGFECNIVGANAYLSWEPVPDIDYSHCRIRWTPEKTTPSWTEAVDIVTRVGKPATSVTVPAMIGTYLIKAVDYRGNESENAAVNTTTIARVQNMNYVVSVEQPAWSGTEDGLVYDESVDGLILDTVDDEMLEEGYFELAGYTDLGAVFTARVTAVLDVGVTILSDDLYDYTDLYAVANLYGVLTTINHGVLLEVATTEDDPSGTPTWSGWKRFVIGDYTARAFRFRLYGYGVLPDTTPIVNGVEIIIDMEDRLVNISQVVPVDGIQINFSPAFYATPELGIAVLDGVAGDSYEITGLDESGFFIEFFNGGSSVSRTISGIARAYGYKED